MTPDAARKIVFDAKPAFAELYLKYKDRKWADYATENYPKSFAPNARFPELKSAVSKILTPLLDATKVACAIETLQSTGFLSTADHSGVLCHPFFSNSALIRSENMAQGSSIISFTCGGVSLTNSSYPRGIFFHDKNLNEIRIPLVSLKGRKRSVYGLTAFSKGRIQSIQASIHRLNIGGSTKTRLTDFFSNILNSEKIFEVKKYSDQLTIINDLLWQRIFGSDRGNLVYVEAENIIRQTLLDVHLDTNTLIHKALFDERVRDAYIYNFERVVGAHNTAADSGSHLFWYIDDKAQARVQLFAKDNRLESKDQRIKIQLDPETLREHLKNYTLLPSMALCYAILAGYYGLTLGGGFSQIKYLGDILKAWHKTADSTGEEAMVPRTDIFSGEFVLTGVSNKSDTKPASLIDILLYCTDPEVDYLVRQPTASEQVNLALDETIGETIDAMMDEFVEIVTGEKPVIEGIKIHKTFHV